MGPAANTDHSPSDAVAFVVVSCDRYADLWDPFFHSLRKYWPDIPYRTYLVTNHRDYATPDATVVKVGDDRSYADNLRVALSQIEEPWVILWLEDIFISRPVETARLQTMVKQAQRIPVGYLKISPDLPLSYDERLGEIGPIPKGVRYRSAVGLSLYKVETLEKLLTPGASAWDLDVSTMSNDLDEPFFALTGKAARHPPVTFVNGVNKGRWNWPAVAFLKKEGFGYLLASRQRLSARGHAYLLAFTLHNRLFRTLKKYWY